MLFRKKKQPSLLKGVGKQRIKATLVFSSSKTMPLLNWLLKDGFAHVKVVIHKEGYNVWVDPRAGCVNVECYPSSDILVKADGERHVLFDRILDTSKVRRIFGPLNCVEAAKMFLGISNPLLLTPYQLYKEVSNG